MSLCIIDIADIVSIRKRRQYMSNISAAFSFSYVIVPLIGGLFTDHINWRWVFFVNVPLAIIAFVFILLFFKNFS